MSRPRTIRELLRDGDSLVLAGAHNGLSARLVQEAGFEGVWASGFEISASWAVPDANILTMAESLAATRQMVDAVDIPVIADCDNGFGNAINVIRTVKDYEAAGVAGICIEDNVFPKRCSFYAGVKRELCSLEEHAGKVRAAKQAQRSSEFVVVARTEALIAGWGMEEALRRARAYSDAGADFCLIHSKARTAEEVTEFARRWDRDTPLVCVPTIYREATVSQLREAGYRMIIMANHGLRSAVKAMQETYAVLRREGYAGAVEDRIVPLPEIYRLVRQPEMKADEAAYLPADGTAVTAIILAAGFGESLLPLIEEVPTSMLEIRGRTILDLQVAALNAAGVKDLVVVRGYRKEQIDLPNLRYYDADFEAGGEVASLFAAAAELDRRVIVLYGDILFGKSIAEKLLKSPDEITIVADRSWRDTVEGRGGGKPDLVEEAGVPPDAPHRFLPDDTTAAVRRIGRGVPHETATAEFIGMVMLTEEGCGRIREIRRQWAGRAGAPFHEAASFSQATLPDLLQEVVASGGRVSSVAIHKGWTEIDTFLDYQRAWAERTGEP